MSEQVLLYIDHRKRPVTTTPRFTFPHFPSLAFVPFPSASSNGANWIPFFFQRFPAGVSGERVDQLWSSWLLEAQFFWVRRWRMSTEELGGHKIVSVMSQILKGESFWSFYVTHVFFPHHPTLATKMKLINNCLQSFIYSCHMNVQISFYWWPQWTPGRVSSLFELRNSSDHNLPMHDARGLDRCNSAAVEGFQSRLATSSNKVKGQGFKASSLIHGGRSSIIMQLACNYHAIIMMDACRWRWWQWWQWRECWLVDNADDDDDDGNDDDDDKKKKWLWWWWWWWWWWIDWIGLDWIGLDWI